MIFVEFGVFPSISFCFIDSLLFSFQFNDSVLDWAQFFQDFSELFLSVIVFLFPECWLKDVLLMVWIESHLQGIDWDWRTVELEFVGVNPLRGRTYTLWSSVIMFEDYFIAVGFSLVYSEGWSTFEAAC